MRFVEESVRRAELNTELSRIWAEKSQAWILGGDPSVIDSEWDAYVQMLKDVGLDEYMVIQQAAFDRVKALAAK